MKTMIERMLTQIREIGYSKGQLLSCDIYYNDLAVERGEQFVVKIHDAFGMNEHFRAKHIRKALKDALRFAKSLL